LREVKRGGVIHRPGQSELWTLTLKLDAT
jgi:hypothetical protein